MTKARAKLLKIYEENRRRMYEHECHPFCHHRHSILEVDCKSCGRPMLIDFDTEYGIPEGPYGPCSKCKDEHDARMNVMPGKTTAMWKRAVEAARIKDETVLFCIHDIKLIAYLKDIPLDEDGRTIADWAGWANGMWCFPDGGKIIFHTPKSALTGIRIQTIAMDHKAREHFSIAEWEDTILTRLEPDGKVVR